MKRCLLSIDDFSDGEVDAVLARATALGSGAPVEERRGRLVGLVFLEPSLRTRVGFAAAASLLGTSIVHVDCLRESPTSMAESLADTICTISDYVDLVVVRPGAAWVTDDLDGLGSNLLSAGDHGPGAEHPTQALIDMHAIDTEAGDVTDLTLAICGDVRMRAVRSLLRLLRRRPPRRLVLVTDPDIADPKDLSPSLVDVTERREPWDLGDVDVLYVAGMPHESLPLPARERLIVGIDALSSLPPTSVVLSPMPLIDEIAPSVRLDPRIRVRQQSARGLAVRIAVLELLVSRTGSSAG